MVTAARSITSPAYRPELDMLRLFAFVGVFILHAGNMPAERLFQNGVPTMAITVLQSFINAGGYGVDLFFLLSAYLITDLLLREKSRFGKLNVPAFYMRRALRIWPLYFTIITLILVVPSIDATREFSRFALPFLLFAGNWSFVAWGWPNSVLVPLWSVSVEEQFYLLWPPIVARLSRRGILLASGVMIAGANLDRIVEILWLHHSASKMWGNTFAHLDSLGVGIGIAVLLNGISPGFDTSKRWLLFIGGIACIVIRGSRSLTPFSPQGTDAVFTYLLVVIGCAMLLFALLGIRFRSPTLEYLGKISYGLYVFHPLAIYWTDRAFPARHGLGHFTVVKLLGFGSTIALSATSYAFLEKPFLLLKKRFTFVESRPT